MSEYRAGQVFCCGIGAVGELDCFPLNEGLQAADGGTCSLILASTVACQSSAIKRLKKRNYRKILTFKNSNSGKLVTLWGKGNWTPAKVEAPKPAKSRTARKTSKSLKPKRNSRPGDY